MSLSPQIDPSTTDRPQVILCEADNSLRTTLEIILQDAFRVFSTADSNTIVSSLFDDIVPDLVIMDMDDQQCWAEALQSIRSRLSHKRIPILLLGDTFKPELQRWAMEELNPVTLVEKPFGRDVLKKVNTIVSNVSARRRFALYVKQHLLRFKIKTKRSATRGSR